MKSVKPTLSLFLALSLAILTGAQQMHQAANAKPEVVGESNKLQVDLDTTGLAKTTKVAVVPKSPFDAGDEIIHMNGEPRHVRIIFDDQKIESNNDYSKPHLLVYPLAQYATLFPPATKVMFNKRINELKKIIATKSDRGINQLPIMPDSDGYEFLHQQEKYLNFSKGSGIAFISCYGNGDPPLNAGDFFYTFQGLTTDGKHYVSFFWPVKATGFPANSTVANAEKYLHKLARSKFTPSLDTLDQLVSSISIK